MNQDFRTSSNASEHLGSHLDVANPEKGVSLGRNLLSLWYNLTAPSDPGTRADLSQREAYRRGRLASLALLLLFLVIFLFMASISITANLNVTVFVSSGVTILALWATTAVLNRYSHLTATAILMIIIIDGGIVTDLFFVRGGLGLVNIPLFDLLIASELIAVSLLKPSSVFIAALLNSAIIVLVIMVVHRAHDLALYIDMSGLAVIIIRPILLQLAVALVTFLFVDSALKALKRADQAVAMAAMERAIAEYERAQADQKRTLENAIQYLVDTQRKVANGDLAARVPVTEDNVLWPVAISFNTLLTRFQHLQHDSDQLQQIQHELPRLIHAIREAKRTQRPIRISRSGTLLDAIILELTHHNTNT
jgi:hypothetical protein